MSQIQLPAIGNIGNVRDRHLIVHGHQFTAVNPKLYISDPAFYVESSGSGHFC
jgi:hypothetical protein